MPKRAFHFYQRKRVVNININVFVSGLLSIAIAKYPIAIISGMIGHEHKLKISILAYIIDTTIDIGLYFGLHWIANHWRPLKETHIVDKLTTPTESRTKNFLVDVGKVQAERIALVPIFAIVATGGMWSIQHFTTIKPDWAFVIAFIVAMLITRVIHTIWGYRSGTFQDEDLRIKDMDEELT
jgi:hypothetical protein